MGQAKREAISDKKAGIKKAGRPTTVPYQPLRERLLGHVLPILLLPPTPEETAQNLLYARLRAKALDIR